MIAYNFATWRLCVRFRFGAGSTTMPRRWRWNGFRTPFKLANTSQTVAGDSVAGAQDFAGTTWDFAGGVRISREASGISRAEARILRERFRTTREACGFRGSRADLAGMRQDFAGGLQGFPGASRNIAGTIWDFAGTPETMAAGCGSTFTASWPRRSFQIGSHYECFPLRGHFAANSVGAGQL